MPALSWQTSNLSALLQRRKLPYNNFDTVLAALRHGDAKLGLLVETNGVVARPNRQIKEQLERKEKACCMFKTLMIEFEKNPGLPAEERVRLANLTDQVCWKRTLLS